MNYRPRAAPKTLGKRKKPAGGLISSNTGLPGAMKPGPAPAKPRPIGRPLRSPGVSPVSKVSRISTKPATPPPTLGKRKRPATGGAQSESAPPGKTIGKRRRPGAPGAGAGAAVDTGQGQQEEQYEEAGLPPDNMPATDDESMMLPDEQQAYYEQSANAEVPVTNEGLFMMNNAPVTKPGLWQRIKAWFTDIFAGEDGISAPLSSAHIKGNVMHVASIVFNDDGAHYVVTKIPCPAARNKNGSVNFGSESNPRWLQGAIVQAKHRIQAQAEGANDRHIEDVVQRARAGDQNAMALIAMVRANAQAGNPRAIASLRAFSDYMDKHPVESSMAGELSNVRSKRAKQAQAAVVFANGRHLDIEVLREFGSSFGEDADCFFQGARDWNKDLRPDIARSADPYRLQVYEVGQVLGRARAIQQMRRPDVPISAYDPMVGWELGE